MSKRKTHTKQRRLNRLGSAILKDCAISFIAGTDRTCSLINVKTKRSFNPGPALAQTIETGRYSWSIICAVFCRDQNGSEYMKSIVIETTEPRQQKELLDPLHENHLALLSECNESHLVNVGWLASPASREWTEKLAGDIFSKLNAWDSLATWETAA